MPLAPSTLGPSPVSGGEGASNILPFQAPGATPSADDDKLKLEIQPDGSAILGDDADDNSPPPESKFDENLAETMDEADLGLLANDLLQGIESDIESRRDWETAYQRGLELLGLKIEEASTNVNPQGTISRVYHPLLLEAIITFQSNAFPELCPADGPVKVEDYYVGPLKEEPPPSPPTPAAPPPMPGAPPGMGPQPPGMAAPGAPPPGMGAPPAQMAPPPSPPPPEEKGPDRVALAEAFEKDFNHYLVAVAKEYYPDYDRMLFLLAMGGCAFRKIYRCPVRRRPVSEFVPAPDLIVSNGTVSLTDCARKTHRIMMRNAQVKRMMASGHWRDVMLVQPVEDPSQIDATLKNIEGFSPSPELPPDFRHTIFESYIERTFTSDKMCKAKYPVPYRVTLDKDSHKVLEVRRNWKEGDEDYKERRRFVKFPLVPGIGFYDLGYVHILGNTTRALTAIERMLLDAGQFSCFPGLLVSKQGQRQETNQIRVPPGGAAEIDTGGMPIQQSVMGLPYKEPSMVLAQLADTIAQQARKLGSAVELPVGEGKADIPVGTAIAMIEQATKVMAAVHKRLHMSQSEEFELLRELFVEDPKALWRFAKNPQRKWEIAEEFDDLNLVPAADPNTPSHLHRLMQSQALVLMATSTPVGQALFNQRAVAKRALRTLGVQDIDEVLNPLQSTMPQPGQQMDPAAMAAMHGDQLKAQAKQQELALKAKQQEMETQRVQMEGQMRLHELTLQSHEKERERSSRLELERMKIDSQERQIAHQSATSHEIARLNAESQEKRTADQLKQKAKEKKNGAPKKA